MQKWLRKLIRKAELKDLEKCAEVIRNSFSTVAEEFNITKENAPKYVAYSITSDKLAEQFSNGRLMYVCEKDNNIIGFFSLDIFNDECELNNFCVLPEYRHKCIGKSMLDFAISLAVKKNVKKIRLSIVEENTVLAEWYSSFGFVHTHTIKYDFFPFTCGYMEMNL